MEDDEHSPTNNAGNPHKSISSQIASSSPLEEQKRSSIKDRKFKGARPSHRVSSPVTLKRRV
jgi:hypothetical protein